jgi:hypothetical protein
MKRSIISALVAASLAFASCASVPAQGKAPDWIFETPKPDAANTYFVGSSSDQNGDQAAAANDAAANLMSSIMQYIGVKTTTTTSAEAKATLDSYSANIRSSVTSSSQNQVSGFSVKQRFIQKDKDKKSKRVTAFVLAAYATADLEKEKARILKVFKEREDAVAKPEAEGRSLEDSGRAYEAVRKYVEAAVAASGADIDNADIKLERNINAARSVLSRIRFDASASTGYRGFVGQDFKQPFAAKLVTGEGAAAPGIPGAVVLFSYQRKSGTRLVTKTESVMTDASGAIVFTPPAPDFVGKAKFTMRLDFQSTLDLLDKLPEKFAANRDSLASELKAKSVDQPYEVVSNARGIAMAVAILDLDESGGAVAGSKAQAGLIEALLREKFSVKGVTVSKDDLVGMNEAAVQAAAAAAGKFERVAFGTARAASVRKDGSNYLATGKAVVKVLEIASGRILYSAERGATGLGSDENSARAALYRELGLNAVGKDLLSNLP